MFNSKSLLALLLAGMAACGGTAEAIDGATSTVEKKHLIAIKTNDFDLQETDVSHLAIGESETIVTGDGKTIDILRTEEGMELYVDGVLQDMNFGEMLHGEHQGLHREIEFVCTKDDDCSEMVWITEAGEKATTAGDETIIEHEITVECEDDRECVEENIWITEDGESVNIEKMDGEVHVIRLHEGKDDSELADNHDRVIVIKRKSEHD